MLTGGVLSDLQSRLYNVENILAKDVVKQINFSNRVYQEYLKGNLVPNWSGNNNPGPKKTLNVTGMAIVRMHAENDKQGDSAIYSTGFAFWMNGIKIAEADCSTGAHRTEDTNTAVIPVKPGDTYYLSGIQSLDPNLSYNEFCIDVFAFV